MGEYDKKLPNRWTEEQKDFFHTLFPYFALNQELFKHPKASELPHELWVTTAWNTAWIAAQQYDG